MVTDAMVGQPAMRWTLDALQRDFGNEAVLVNNRAPARRADAKVGPPQRSMQVQLSGTRRLLQRNTGVPDKVLYISLQVVPVFVAVINVRLKRCTMGR